MRSKATWWSLVILFAAVYGIVGLTATFAQAFETLFDRRDELSVLRSAGAWMETAALIALGTAFVAGMLFSAFSLERATAACADLIRLNAAALCGASLPYALGSEHPWASAAAVLAVTSIAIALDRKCAAARPWQTWALAAMAVLVAAPMILISRL